VFAEYGAALTAVGYGVPAGGFFYTQYAHAAAGGVNGFPAIRTVAFLDKAAGVNF